MGRSIPGKLLFFFIFLSLTAGLLFSPVPATGTETIITSYNNSFNHKIPKIFNDQIVWQDIDSSESFGIIYEYNITSGVETQVTDNTTFTQNPAISSNLVSYTDCGGSSFCSPSIIYLYDLATETRTALSPVNDQSDNSAISNNRIVWTDTPASGGPSQIYINSTPPGTGTLLNASGNNQAYPAIFNNLVAYTDCGADPTCSHPSVIYLYNIITGTRTQISSGSNWNTYPSLYNNNITWLEASAFGNPAQVMINETSLEIENDLTPGDLNLVTTPPTYPDISGSWVVWFENNATPGNSGNSDIYVNDTSAHQTIPIALDRAGIEQVSIAYSSAQPLYRIVWDEQDSGWYNIHLYTSGPSQTCPVANFTNDFTGGNAPVTVYFTDNSSQDSSINYWYWDFGDGSNSTSRNPSHTYTANGQYTVSLTVSDPYCRNTTTVTNDVVIGQPIAGFTASTTTAAAPATIAFTDKSTGNPAPNQWNWSWGDGSWTNGTTENPSHQYANAGVYSVTLIASNIYGSGSVTKSNYIQILNGANVITNTSIPGLSFVNAGGRQVATLDDSILTNWTYPLYPNISVLEFTPLSDRGFGNITLYACDGIGFGTSGHYHTGNITAVTLQTENIVPTGFSVSTGGPFCSVDYLVNLTTYPVNALLNTQVWEGSFPPDTSNFNTVAAGSGFGGTNGTAYTIKVYKTNFPSGGTAVLHMSLNSSLVASKPGGRNDVFVERIDDSGTYGQVLGTHYLYHNSTSNLDYFEADSPNGLSTFGLSFLEGAGNLFQLITLTVSSEVVNSNSGASESGSGSGPAAVAATPAAVTPTVIPQVTQASVSPTETPDPGKTANLYINTNSNVITQATTLQSNDHLATLSIGDGIVAENSAGAALSSVTIKGLLPPEVPSSPGSGGSSFTGMAYELTPDGATFSPTVTLTFTDPQATWGKQYTIRSYDHVTNTWQDLPTTYDPSKGTITAQLSHFCCFALFSTPVASSAPIAAPLLAPTEAPAPPSPPAPTAVSTFVGIIGWIADTTNGHLYLVGIAVIAIAALLYAHQRRHRRRRGPLE
jgi:PKD repeat protein